MARIREVTITNVALRAKSGALEVSLTFAHPNGGTVACTGDASWFARVLEALGIDLQFAVKHACRLQVIGQGEIVGIGHARQDRWFDPRAPEQVAATARRDGAKVDRALRHINRKRWTQRPLASGAWSDDDVFAEARRLGWTDA